MIKLWGTAKTKPCWLFLQLGTLPSSAAHAKPQGGAPVELEMEAACGTAGVCRAVAAPVILCGRRT